MLTMKSMGIQYGQWYSMGELQDVEHFIKHRAPFDGWGKHGPYTLHVFATNSPDRTHAVANKYDTAVFLGTEEICQCFMERVNTLHAEWIMVQGTAAENYHDQR